MRSSIAQQIYSREVTTATQARELIREVFPSDDDFRAAFLKKQERNNQKVKYMLSGLEGQSRRATGGAPLGDELEAARSLTVEHILPRSPEGEWLEVVQEDPGIQEECTFMIGNICLLTSVNRSLGNRCFREKKGVFVQSTLTLTNSVAALDQWNRASIEARQAQLARMAVAHWRFE